MEGEEQDDDVVVETPEQEEAEITVDESKEDLAPEEKNGSGEDEPGENHPRFKKIYGKMKGFERELEESKLERAKDKGLMAEMRGHNKNLVDSFERISTSQHEASATKTEADATTKAEGNLADLKTQRRAAREEQNFALADELDDKIDDAKDDLREVKASAVKRKTTKPAPSRGIEVPVAEAEEFDKFAQNPWYNPDPDNEDYDPEMNDAARRLDVILSNDQRWGRKPLAKRLAEVKKRIEKRFGWESPSGKEEPNSGKRSANSVEGSGGSGRSNVVKLSAAELVICEGLGVTAQEFAKQKQMMKRG